MKFLIDELKNCDQNYLLSALGEHSFMHEQIRIIFKLTGTSFPPSILYTVELINAVRPGNIPFQVPNCILSQQIPFLNKNKYYRTLIKPKSTQQNYKVQHICSPYELSVLCEISSKKIRKKKRETYRQKQARKLKQMFGIAQKPPIKDLDIDFFAASQASDLKEFIELLNSSDKKFSEDAQDQVLDMFFEANPERVNIDDIINGLPGSQF